MKKYLQRKVLMGMLLGVTIMPFFNAKLEAADLQFTAGDYTAQGEYSLVDTYNIDPSSDINIVATGDITLKNSHTDPNIAYTSSTANIRYVGTKKLDVNMNGYNLTLDSDFLNVRSDGDNASNGSINIHDIDKLVFRADSKTQCINSIYLPSADTVSFSAKTIEMTATGTNTWYPLIFTSNVDAAVTLSAVNDMSLWTDGRGCDVAGGTITLNSSQGNINIDSYATPLFLYGNTSNLIINSGNAINIHGTVGNGIYNEGGNLSLTAVGDIKLTSDGTSQIIVCNSKTKLVSSKGNITIDGENGSSGVLTVDGVTELTADKDINVKGNLPIGINLWAGQADYISKTGTINISATKDVDDNAGVHAWGQGNLNLHSNTNIIAIRSSVYANDHSVITFDKGLTATAATYVVKAEGSAKVLAISSDSAKKLAGKITADGAGTSVDMNLATADSYFTGSTDVTNSGAVSLAFANAALWNVTADSELTNLDNNAIVNMRYTGNNTSETVTAANLSGNGTYIMNTDLQASKDSGDVQQNGDKLIITTSSTGNNVLELRDITLDTKLCSEGYLLLVEDQSNGSATFTGKDLDHGGIFRYRPVITTANPSDYIGFNAAAKNWYLTGFERTIDVSDNTNVTRALGDTRYANYLADNDTLLKRLGELRMLKDQPANDGFWARYRHGSNKTNAVDGKFTTFQLGYDKRTSSPAAKAGDGERYTGVAFSHTDNKYNGLGVGYGEGSQDALSVYNTWLGEKEHYFDIVAKVGKMRGNSTYEDSLFPETGDYGVWFYSLSGEYGRKNKNTDGWYYEPQIQLTLGRINGDDYTTSRDTTVSQDSISSVLLRTGVTIGKEYNMDKPEKHSNIYAKINWLHDFCGDSGLNMTDTYGDSASFTNELGDSYWNAGFGATMNLNKRTHLYVDFEKNFGGHVTSNWIGQAGCRWTW